jgi:hypothetical protein
MSMMKAQAAKVPAKAPPKAPAKGMSKSMSKVSMSKVQVMSKAPAKPKAQAKPAAKAPARKKSLEAMLARVEAVRLMQREEGHFDCFGRAGSGYCDQGGCAHHAECLSISRMLHAM